MRTDLAEPTLGDRYQLRSVLGSGGMGTVWEAWDLRLARPVALKILRDDLPPSAANRLEREAKAAARINDPRVVTVLDLDRTPDGAPYLVLEAHDGGTLADELRTGPMTLQRLDQLIEDLLGALAAAHDRNVLHRDVKPANVLVDADAFRVTDFGLASLDDDQSTETDLMGTLVYVAPERLDGARGSPRSDVFSAAVVIYEAATGIQPFRGRDAAESVARLRAGAASPLPDHLPAPLRTTIEAALSPDPGRRPADAAAMLDAIRTDGVEPARSDDPTVRLDTTSVLPAWGDLDRARSTSTPNDDEPTGPLPAPAPRPAPVARPPRSSERPASRAAATLLHRPEVVIGAVAATVLLVMLLVVAIDGGSDTANPPGGDAVPADAGDDPSGAEPATLDQTLERIEEIGR